MQKIEYKKIPISILQFPNLGEDGWIYSYCPSLEEKGFMLFYKIFDKKKPVVPRANRDPDDIFVKFYEFYPRKSGPKKAFDSWVRLTEKEKEIALKVIPSHKKWYKDRKTKMEFIPLCTTWLNGKMWLRNDMEGLKSLEQIEQEEKNKAIALKKAQQDRIVDSKRAEEGKKISEILVDLKNNSPERYEQIVSQAISELGIPPDDVKSLQSKFRIDMKIRSIICDKFIENAGISKNIS